MSVAAKDVLLGLLYPRIYRRELRGGGVERGYVLYAETHREEMPEAFKCTWSALADDGNYHQEFFSLERRTSSFRNYVKNCIALVRKIAHAQYVFLNDASDLVSCLPLSEETTVVQLWHACGAFKKWGMSTAEKNFGGTAWEKERHPFYENLDLVTVSSPEVIWAYEEAMALSDRPGIVQALGVSRTDVFFDEVFLANARATVQSAVPQLGGRKIILYAPTFRGNTNHAKAPDFLNICEMARKLSKDYVLLVKHHPFVQDTPAIPESCSDFAIDVGHVAIDRLLAAADVCITDYSSIVFEYSLFERPLAFFAPDRADYDDWRGFYYDYDELAPGPIIETTADLAEWVLRVGQHFDASEVRAFRDRFMSACDGHATERILTAVGIKE